MFLHIWPTYSSFHSQTHTLTKCVYVVLQCLTAHTHTHTNTHTHTHTQTHTHTHSRSTSNCARRSTLSSRRTATLPGSRKSRSKPPQDWRTQRKVVLRRFPVPSHLFFSLHSPSLTTPSTFFSSSLLLLGAVAV